jgi:hypothetical protein
MNECKNDSVHELSVTNVLWIPRYSKNWILRLSVDYLTV